MLVYERNQRSSEGNTLTTSQVSVPDTIHLWLRIEERDWNYMDRVSTVFAWPVYFV